MVPRSEIGHRWAGMLAGHWAEGASSIARWLLVSVESRRDAGAAPAEEAAVRILQIN